MELTVTREPHGDYAGQNTEHQLKHRGDREVDQRVAIAALPFIFPVAAEETYCNLRDNAGDKDNEGVHHPWIRVMVTISPLAMWLISWAMTASASSRLMFCNSPVLTATSEASRRAPAGEGVNVRRVIDSYLRHGNTYLLRLLRNGIHQPAFRFVARLLDHFPTH